MTQTVHKNSRDQHRRTFVFANLSPCSVGVSSLAALVEERQIVRRGTIDFKPYNSGCYAPPHPACRPPPHPPPPTHPPNTIKHPPPQRATPTQSTHLPHSHHHPTHLRAPEPDHPTPNRAKVSICRLRKEIRRNEKVFIDGFRKSERPFHRLIQKFGSSSDLSQKTNVRVTSNSNSFALTFSTES